MMFYTDNKINNLLINHSIIIMLFFSIYSYHYIKGKDEHFTYPHDIHNLWDIFYYTMTTHSTTGYGDISPKSTQMRIVTSIHMLCVVILSIHLYYVLFQNKS